MVDIAVAGLWGSAGERSDQVLQLAARIARCSAQAGEVLAGFRDIQLAEWQSPAGVAYRDSVAVKTAEVRTALDRLDEAAAAVAGYARATLTAGCPYDGQR